MKIVSRVAGFVRFAYETIKNIDFLDHQKVRWSELQILSEPELTDLSRELLSSSLSPQSDTLIEKLFKVAITDYHLRIAQLTGVVSLISFDSYLYTDYYMVPDLFLWVVVSKFLICTPICLYYILSCSEHSRFNAELAFLCFIACQATLTSYMCLSTAPYAWSYIFGMVGVCASANLFQLVPLRTAASLTGFSIAFCVLGLLLCPGIPGPIALYAVLVCSVICLMALYGNYRINVGYRQHYVSRLKEKFRVDALKISNHALRLQAEIDGLTGIYNRRYLDTVLPLVIADHAKSGKSVAILMIDVDHFKRLNDQYGHLIGDQCLQSVAAALSDNLRRDGDILSRFGGEEFVIVLTNTEMNEAMLIAERIRNAIEQTQICILGQTDQLRLTASIGVDAGYPTLHASAVDFLRRADQAVYCAKSLGRNRVENSSTAAAKYQQQQIDREPVSVNAA